MKSGFYFKTASDNIIKNYRFFVPQVLAGSGLLGCFYIIYTLAMDKKLAEINGGDYIPTFMIMGAAIMGGLSVILKLYTNSFLMRQRKREFGLYNVLGMEKKHIGLILYHESLISSTVCVILGLVFGILFYKICSLLICKLLAAEIIIGFYFISAKTLVPCALLFILIDLVIYGINRISIARLKPVELLQSKNAGEREPRVKWILLIIGVITLGIGYYISLTTESPLQAIFLFFLAVVLVIVGTYCLFITGTTFILKLLKKNEKYYYSKNHMPSVSGLLYRMKQNAVGLASICILATAVLVMVSTTVSLYSGIEQTISSNYPDDLYFSASYENTDGRYTQISADKLYNIVAENAEKNGVEIKQYSSQQFLEVSFVRENKEFVLKNADDQNSIDNITSVTFITEDEYNSLSVNNITLNKNEIALAHISMGKEYTDDTVKLSGLEFDVKEKLYYFPISNRLAASIDCIGIVVSDDSVIKEIYEKQLSVYGENASKMSDRLTLSFKDNIVLDKIGATLHTDINTSVDEYVRSMPDHNGPYTTNFDSVWEARESTYGMYGTLLFLGLLLGFVFLFATTLIIYYKQISEGYEDRNRYQIMQNIGMSSDEVQKTISSQIILVFFLPLMVAGIHTAVAFPILLKLLRILLLSSTWLFVGCTVTVFLAFSLIYFLIYYFTAKTYYKIVH